MQGSILFSLTMYSLGCAQAAEESGGGSGEVVGLETRSVLDLRPGFGEYGGADASVAAYEVGERGGSTGSGRGPAERDGVGGGGGLEVRGGWRGRGGRGNDGRRRWDCDVDGGKG